MGSFLPTFSLYRLRLELALGERRHTLPAYLGSTVRGIFAASFRHLVCVTQAPVCDGCLLINRCPYPYIFETPAPSHLPAHLQKRFRQAPRPYIFDVPRLYSGDAALELGLVLVGRAFDFLPYFLFVLHETGKQGMGRARVPYRLVCAADGSMPDGPLIFRSEDGMVHDGVHAVTWEDVRRPGDTAVEQVTLEFLTPLRIKKYGGYQAGGDRLDFAVLLDLLLGRLEALALFHCGAEWTPHDALREAARCVQVSAMDLSLQRLQRYSNRRNVEPSLTSRLIHHLTWSSRSTFPTPHSTSCRYTRRSAFRKSGATMGQS
jgi:hypothetical protein